MSDEAKESGHRARGSSGHSSGDRDTAPGNGRSHDWDGNPGSDRGGAVSDNSSSNSASNRGAAFGGRYRGLASLTIVAAVAAAMVAGTWLLTAERIHENQLRFEENALAAVLPGVVYDNLLADSRHEVHAPDWLGPDPAAVWVASRDGQAVAVIVRTTAPDGYNGDIQMLVGLSATGEVLGVETIAHRETPGLGDFIETRRSGWLQQFFGFRLGNPPLPGWALARENGQFDAVTGATVTSRAAVGAIRGVLLYFDRHREELLGLLPSSASEP